MEESGEEDSTMARFEAEAAEAKRRAEALKAKKAKKEAKKRERSCSSISSTSKSIFSWLSSQQHLPQPIRSEEEPPIPTNWQKSALLNLKTLKITMQQKVISLLLCGKRNMPM